VTKELATTRKGCNTGRTRRSGTDWTPDTAASASRNGEKTAWLKEADARTRTGDPFITSEVLYQLSYVGAS
jgi:hypothetical protein